MNYTVPRCEFAHNSICFAPILTDRPRAPCLSAGSGKLWKEGALTIA